MVRAWPAVSVTADFTQGPPNISGGNAVSLVRGPTELRQLATSRGRQYEMGQVSAGTMALDLTDKQEYLNPVNASSPWNSGSNSLLPYRCVQAGAWWNTSTKNTAGNLMNSTNLVPGSVTPYSPSFEASTSGWFALAGSPTLATSATQAFDGTKSLACTFTASADKVAVALFLPLGQAMTASLYVFVPVSHTVTASLINFPGAIGTTVATATSSTTGAWQRLTLTGTPTSQLAILQVQVATGAFNAVVYLDATQFEIGSSASTFTAVGPTYFPIYSGYIERYPQAWDNAGFRGIKALQAVDALSALSRIVISQSYAQTVKADNPDVFVPYNDTSGPHVVQRLTGGQQMAGYTQLGSNSGAVNFSGDTFTDGSKAVTVVQQNTTPDPGSGDNTALTVLGTRGGGLTMNPQKFSLELWFKLSNGIAYFGAGSMTPGESTLTEVHGPAYYMGMYTANGVLCFHFTDPNGGGFTYGPASPYTGYPDSSWHYVCMQFVGSSNWHQTTDGTVNGVGGIGFTPSTAIVLNNLFASTTAYHGDAVSSLSVANWALYPTVITASQIAAHYQRGIGFLGEKSGTRAGRLLAKYWSSSYVATAGNIAMAADFSYNGRQLLSVLQEIADTEGGAVYADAAGTVHQESRTDRYSNESVSRFVFGENVAGGELPYEENIAYDVDPTYVYSEADLTTPSGQLYTSVNATSQTAYGQRILVKSPQMQNDWDVQQAANFYTTRYAKPAGLPGTGAPPRLEKLTIRPSANVNLFTAALTLDISHRVTVTRRTSAGTVITGDYYIEQVNHHINGTTGEWSVDYQLSPVFVPNVWVLASATKGVLTTTTRCPY